MISKGVTELSNFKLGSVQLSKICKGLVILWENFSVPFEETKNATSTSHYSCSVAWDTDDLSNMKVTKVVVYTSTRGLSGDGYTTIDVTTKGGTRIYKDKYNYYYSSGMTEEGVNYTMKGEDLPSSKARIAITFDKPVALTSAKGWCGSDVGQWREKDSISITLTGLRKP